MWFLRRLLLCTGCLLFGLSGVQGALHASELGLQQLQQRADAQDLASHLDWLNLLHYKKTLMGSPISQADDPEFFLAADGHTDARAELNALIESLWGRDEAKARSVICRFPARSTWLSRQLGEALLQTDQQCAEFQAWLKPFQSSGLTLLFPSMYLNNPASMFGHTFLRFDNNKSELLRHTLSYAARPDETDAFISYAWKGITGGYSGRFAVQPYFETLIEYSDIEQRDIWEYSLNLEETEIAQMLRHLWEVKDIHFEYFFLRENCSYRLLALLDVARPGMNLSFSSHPVFAAPVDVVRDVINAGLVKQTQYRPARGTRLIQMAQQLGSSNTERALQISSGAEIEQQLTTEMDRTQQAKVLRFADELMSSRGSSTSADEMPENQHKVLSQLSQLGLSPQETAFEFRATPPELSHATSRWQLSAGELEHQRYYEIGLRPVFHDVLDDPQGLLSGASVTILEGRLRWYKDTEELEPEKLTLIELRSLIESTPWDLNLSKQMRFEWLNRNEFDAPLRVFKSEVGLGYAHNLSTVLVFAMANLRLDYSHRLSNDHAGFLGAELGILWQASQLPVQLEVNLRSYQRLSGEQGDIDEIYTGIQFNLHKQHALRLEGDWLDDQLKRNKDIRFSYLYYF